MGSLTHFHLPSIRIAHKLKSFVETGTADGHGVQCALAAGFEVIHSIEIMPDIAEAARLRFKTKPKVNIWSGSSAHCLPMVLKELSLEPCLFWLDAHFPGAHGHGQEYDAERDAAKRLPLHDELRMIRAARPDIKDVILIDDTRIYVPGPYSHGDAPPEVLQATAGLVERGPHALDFVRDVYGDTHNFVIDYEAEGFGMVFPKMEKACLAA